jgi:hypothetical protein
MPSGILKSPSLNGTANRSMDLSLSSQQSDQDGTSLDEAPPKRPRNPESPNDGSTVTKRARVGFTPTSKAGNVHGDVMESPARPVNQGLASANIEKGADEVK